MATGKQIAVVVIAATIAMTLFAPISGMVSSSSGSQSVTNETFTASIDERVELDGYDVESGSETVYWYNSTTESYETVDDSDYTFHYEGGDITIESGGDISDGDDMRVDYEYQATSGATTTVMVLIPLFVALMVLGAFADELSDKM